MKRILVILVLVLAVIAGYHMPDKQSAAEHADKEDATISDMPVAEDAPEQVEVNFDEYKRTETEILRFTNEDLGFSFEYPAWFGELDFRYSECVPEGKSFEGTFKNVELEFGSVADSCDIGRGWWFTDYNGNRGDTTDVVREKIPIDSGEIGIIEGQGRYIPGEGYPEGTYGALVPLKHEIFKGFAFAANITYTERTDDHKLSYEEFLSVVRSISLD